MMWFGLVLFVSGLDLGQNMYCFHDMIHMILILKKTRNVCRDGRVFDSRI